MADETLARLGSGYYHYNIGDAKNHLFSFRFDVRQRERAILVFTMTCKEQPSVCRGTLKVGVGSTIDVVMLQAGPTHDLATDIRIELEENAVARVIYVNISPEKVDNKIEVDLIGEHSELTLDGVYTVKDGCAVNNHTLVRHIAPNATSRQLFKGVVYEGGVADFSGLIVVEKGAQKTQANQITRHLLADPNARAKAEPHLEIYADDVKCSHGATTGQISEEQLFYMQQRGIPEEYARQLLAVAFLDEIVMKIPIETVRETLQMQLEV